MIEKRWIPKILECIEAGKDYVFLQAIDNEDGCITDSYHAYIKDNNIKILHREGVIPVEEIVEEILGEISIEELKELTCSDH